MRSLSDIFTNSAEVSREILFEDGLWCIYRKESDIDPINVIHRCATVHWAVDRDHRAALWACGNNENGGSGCGEVMPDGIKGLYMLHAWDK